MKKAVAYTATAILLGFAVMMVPLALQTGPPTYEPKPQLPFLNAPTETRYDTIGEDASRAFELATKPSNLIPSGLILLSGLIVALGVYVFLRKRIA